MTLTPKDKPSNYVRTMNKLLKIRNRATIILFYLFINIEKYLKVVKANS